VLEKSEKWSAIKSALEEKSVKDVADEFDTTPGAITLALVRTGSTRDPVPSAGSPAPSRKRHTRKKRGESKPDVSEVNGLHVRKGTKDADIAEYAELLGKETDAVVGEKAGVSARTVAAFRRRNGIKGRRGRAPKKKSDLPPEKGTGKKKKLRSRGKPSKLDPYVHLLGTMPDREVAEMAGVSANAAAAFRRRRSIPSFRDNQAAAAETESAAAPAAKAPSAPKKSASRRKAKGGQGVYRVDLQGNQVAFVLASDLVDAAKQVDGRKGVVGVAFAGNLLG